MATENYRPLLVFPAPTLADRSTLGGGGSKVKMPPIGRQRVRIGPQLAVLQQAFNARRMTLQEIAPAENPELILVFEIVGTVDEFAKAVRKIDGLEWLLEWAEEQIPPDEDFYIEGKAATPFSGRLFLLASNDEALQQLLALWERYQEDPSQKFETGLNKFRNLFTQLRTIRYWGPQDRIDEDIRQYWQNILDAGVGHVRFEIEAWHFASAIKNEDVRQEVEGLVGAQGGSVISRLLLNEIAYHGFLVELPAPAVTRILEGEFPDLVLSDRVMFFRPKAQSISEGSDSNEALAMPSPQDPSDQPPIVALLDGLPLQNHPHLQGRLIVDDPDGWENGYEAKDRVHGSAMASLILHGELDSNEPPSTRQLYVRPVLRPDLADNFHARRREHTPDDVLLLDLIHRAVKRICEGEGGNGPVAPSVRVINLSIGDESRLFDREMSPWARLLDWLAFKHGILFIVSAGNDIGPLSLDIAENGLAALSDEDRSALAFRAMTAESVNRRLLAPSEAVNALTVGALHGDVSVAPPVPGRYDLFSNGSLSPISRLGHGYRRSIKPEILMPGGRALYRPKVINEPGVTLLDVVTFGTPPGQRVAIPPMPGGAPNQTSYCRGTSNAAALASRAASQAYEVVEQLRQEDANAPSPAYDAVLLKAMLVHGAQWGAWSTRLLAERPAFAAIANGNTRRAAEKDFITRWLGYGVVETDRGIKCTAERATLIGVGELGEDEAFIYSAPLPPSLAGKLAWRRVTVTLAYFSPINCAHQGYRRAKLWLSPPQDELRVKRTNSVHDKAALRGSVQHEILEGEDAVAFVDGARFQCKVNCAADAGELVGKVKFALCVSLEVAIGSEIAVYQEIRDRIQLPVLVQT